MVRLGRNKVLALYKETQQILEECLHITECEQNGSGGLETAHRKAQLDAIGEMQRNENVKRLERRFVVQIIYHVARDFQDNEKMHARLVLLHNSIYPETVWTGEF